MNILKILIASILLISFTHANETSEATVDMEKLPPESQREIQQAIDSARQAREVYLRAIVQANERASSRLARHIQAATRRGDLEGALAVQNAITALEGGWIKDEIEAVVDMFGNRVVTKNINVIKAEYTWGNDHSLDITQNVQGLVNEDGTKIEFRSLPNVYNVPDPAPGIRKIVNMTILVKGEVREVSLTDGQLFSLSSP